MFSDRIFRIAFLFSIIAHGAFFFTNPNLSIIPRHKPPQTEVRYLKTKVEAKTQQQPRRAIRDDEARNRAPVPLLRPRK